MAAFRFKSFDRPGEHDASSDYDDAAPIAAAELVELELAPRLASVPPAPSPVVAAPAKTIRPPAAQQVRDAAPVNEAFGRLIRQNEPRAKRNLGFRLNLPPRPRIVEVTPVANDELLVAEVLNRLSRLGASKVSLIRQRGEA
ncbi:MAG: hypothetical protein Q8M37_13045 [Nevskia sp.]|nr:hypothetical protein [Nevskia sp.]